MDSSTVVIGRDVGGRKAKAAETQRKMAEVQRRREASQEKIRVYVDGIFVREMEIGLMKRFSQAAATAFPTKNITSNVGTAGEMGKRAGAKEGMINVDQLNKQVKDLTTKGKGSKEVQRSAAVPGGKVEAGPDTKSKPSETSNIEGEKMQAGNPVTSAQKVLNLSHGDGTVGPTPQAIGSLLDLMLSNQNVRWGRPLSTLKVPANVSAIAMLDMYSATILLGLRPFPRTLEDSLRSLVSRDPPSPNMVREFLARLPKSPVLTRLLTSITQYHEAVAYLPEEFQEIRAIINQDSYIKWRFDSIMRAKNAEARAYHYQQRMAANWTRVEGEAEKALTEDYKMGSTEADVGTSEGVARGHDSQGESQAVKPSVSERAQVKTKVEGQGKGKGKGKQPEKLGNGKGVGGRHVPGA
ncbi:hypothetical protein KC332_g3040 [Hortaea werneckii]|nr:hypothetical protein KC358_g6200 [Hortaea werneckii]KAI6849611.1 hypothetical protein KC350_g2507 [Hortaea werneckii]KAI6939554.1 hypothetical protein KC341_g4076 [Hortaea werneckii]KAI6942367.1 hypothetical protein KC348_g4452 [Hortaea werneckii]KAI6975049.1 hypothetical protein KC321_g4783 [Hortaea werneckii]